MGNFSENIKLKADSITGRKERLENLEKIFYDKFVINQRKLKTREAPKFARYMETAFNDVNELIRLEPDNYKYYEKRIQLRLWNYKINFNKNISSPSANIINDFKQMILLYSENELYKENRHDLYDITVFTHNALFDLSNEIRNDILEETIKILPSNTDAYWLANYLLAYVCELKEKIMLYNKIINNYKKDNLIKLTSYIDRAVLYKLFAESFFAADLYSDIFDFKNAVNILTESLEYIKKFNKEENDYRIQDIYYARGQFNEYEENFREAINDYSYIINSWKNGKCSDKIKNAYESRIRLYKKLGETEKAFSDFLEMWDIKDDNNLQLDDFVSVKRKYVVIDDC